MYFVSHPHAHGHLGCFQFAAIADGVAVDTPVHRSRSGHLLPSLLGKDVGAELLDHMIGLCLTLLLLFLNFSTTVDIQYHFILVSGVICLTS